MNDCLSNCSNKGSCKRLDGKYICVCDTDYTGSKCQVNARPCSFNPCSNNSTCLENRNNRSNISTKISNSNQDDTLSPYSFKCLCNEYFYGDKCQYSIDLCKNQTCSGHGNCVINQKTVIMMILHVSVFIYMKAIYVN